MAEVVEDGAVELVRAGARDDRDLRAGRAPVLGRVGRGLYLKFLDGLDRDEIVRPAEHGQGRQAPGRRLTGRGPGRDADVRRDAVHRKIVGVGALARGGELPLLVEAGARQGRPRREFEKGLEAAAVEGQVLDELPVDERRHGRRLARGRVDVVVDGDGLADFADAQLDAQRELVADAERHAPMLDRREALARGRHVVVAGRQERDDVDALFVRRGVAFERRAQVQDRNLDAGDDRPGLVEHRPAERRRRPLRARRRRAGARDERGRDDERRREAARASRARPAVRFFVKRGHGRLNQKRKPTPTLP